MENLEDVVKLKKTERKSRYRQLLMKQNDGDIFCCSSLYPTGGDRPISERDGLGIPEQPAQLTDSE